MHANHLMQERKKDIIREGVEEGRGEDRRGRRRRRKVNRVRFIHDDSRSLEYTKLKYFSGRGKKLILR